VENIYKNLIAVSELLQKKDYFLVHNDIWYKNILINQKWDLVSIIDFETAILAPIWVEYFCVRNHFFYAKNYLEKWWVDYTEMEFLNLLIQSFEKDYPESVYKIWSPESKIYSTMAYFKSLASFDKDRYDNNEVDRYRNIYLW
jgi:thiamine kinase-like enzyme